jgi:methyltransferase (TIGR00027 family)
LIQRPEAAPRSLIAGANALLRMKESSRPSDGGRILDDPFARALAEDHWVVQALRYGRFALPLLYRAIDELQTAHCVRHRAIDELMLAALADGFRQIVIVGAGYDMRAARFAGPLAEVGARVFELDLPATQRRKLARLAALDPPATDAVAVEYSPVDLVTQTVPDALVPTSFDATAPALFVLEGLIHYLPLPRVTRLWAELATGKGARRVVTSFIRPAEQKRAGGHLRAMIGAVGEVPKLTFTRARLQASVRAAGFGELSSWTFGQQVRAFAPMARGRRVGATQDVALFGRP